MLKRIGRSVEPLGSDLPLLLSDQDAVSTSTQTPAALSANCHCHPAPYSTSKIDPSNAMITPARNTGNELRPSNTIDCATGLDNHAAFGDTMTAAKYAKARMCAILQGGRWATSEPGSAAWHRCATTRSRNKCKDDVANRRHDQPPWPRQPCALQECNPCRQADTEKDLPGKRIEVPPRRRSGAWEVEPGDLSHHPQCNRALPPQSPSKSSVK